MGWFSPTAKAVAVAGRWATRRSISKQFLSNYAQTRWLCTIDRPISITQRSRANLPRWEGGCCSSSSSAASLIQKRPFLGVGDGDEGCGLSKVYEEKRVLGYSPEQLFAVVAGVDLYEDFLPWCQRSEVICRYPDGSFDAELEIGFKFLVESYVSHVELKRPNYVKVVNVFFQEVASKLVGSFNDRCRLIYGPGIPVLEKSYEHRA